MKGLRIGRRRSRVEASQRSPLELALVPALEGERWRVPDRFNFTRDVVEALAGDTKRQAVNVLGPDGIIEPRTFAQIAEGAARWAHVLREREVQPGDRVLVLTAGSVDWLEVMLGCMKIGAVSVPTAPDVGALALETRIAASGAALVVVDDERQEQIAQLSFAPDVQLIDDARQLRASDLPDESPTHGTSQRDLAFIVATTGTTGEPKAVAHTHGAVFATRAQAEHWLDAGPGDTVWCTLDWGSPEIIWNTLIGPWSRGAEAVLYHADEFDPRERLDLLYRLSPTILCQTPSEYRALAGVRELSRFRSPRLRRLVSTGEHLEPEVVAVFEEKWGMTIYEGYGQAETNIVLANTTGDEEFRSGSIGRPLPGHHVAVIDDQGNELPAGIEGDLAVRGRPPTLFAGYWEAPDDTKSAFRGDWYLTGDVATVDEDGFFWFMGRAEDVIASRGRTFGPYEIERALRRHDAVADSAAVGLPDLERGGHFVRAFVVLRPRLEASEQFEAELREFVGESLPDQQVPREIEFVDDLPTVNGRVRRAELRDRPVSRRPLWEAPEQAAPETAPQLVPEPAPTAVASPAPPPVEPAAPVPTAAELQPVVEEVVEWAPEQAAQLQPVVEEVVEWAPEQAAELQPVVDEVVESVSEPTPEAQPVVEDVVEWVPEPVAEVQPVVHVTPPAPEPSAAEVVETRLEPEPEPEPEPGPASPEPASPVVLPQEPVAVEAAASEPLPEYVVEPEPAPEPEADSLPEPEAPALPEPDEKPLPSATPLLTEVWRDEPTPASLTREPLPDYVVDPATKATEPPPLPPPPPSFLEPEEEDLGPLPDYVVDPARPVPAPVAKAPEPSPDIPASRPKLVTTPSVESPPISAPSAGVEFPAAPTFPSPSERPERDAPKVPRGRSATDNSTKSRRDRSLIEPGDEEQEVGWMQGLSNRLSAYSLSEGPADAPRSEDPEANGDGETPAS